LRQFPKEEEQSADRIKEIALDKLKLRQVPPRVSIIKALFPEKQGASL